MSASPDTPALRGLLGAIDALLDVPTAAHSADDDLELAEFITRTKTVRIVLRSLLDGPLDNCQIQAFAHSLLAQAVPVHYEVTA